ncbi:phosphoribosylamine--glycine ligase [Candidatus Peregrinibacteria bacterium]|nr:phosphoribosylamine--glycine ligase [Candidatus Peregrinibacteria bacterium]
MAKKVLIIGSGAREHVIAETFMRSRHEVEIFVVGGAKNPGLSALAKDYLIADVCDVAAIVEFARKCGVDFAVVGPEAPIAAGVVDGLLEAGFKSASPLATVGRLESSKGFTRELLSKYGIAGNARFRSFDSEEGLKEFFEELGDDFVVKADGLKGGKGVKVSGDHLNGKAEGLEFALECLREDGRVVVEEKLIGQEFSLMSFCDGNFTCEMPAVQDHKRAFDGDKGGNTGGMGSYSDADHSLPFLRSSDVLEAAEITRNVAKALFEETGTEFKGVMYGGFMATKDGVKLIEYNARFGDPEVMNVLPLLKTDFVDVCEAIINGTLADLPLEFERKATVCKYLVPNGYPDDPVKGEKILVGGGEGAGADSKSVPGDKSIPVNAFRIYYASVDQREDGLYLCGSRAVNCVGIADSISEAEKIAEEGACSISGPVFHRHDIGTAELIEKRVKMMEGLRG